MSLLLAAMLLLANTLVTAHDFGETTHVAADNCQLLHQFERQQQSPVAVAPLLVDAGQHLRPAQESPVPLARVARRHYQPRAPPFA